MRRCAACRVRRPKGELLRFARVAAGPRPEPGPDQPGPHEPVRVDPGQRIAGRGAYACPSPGCLERGLRRGSVARALKVGLSPEQAERLVTTAVEYLRERNTTGAQQVPRSTGIRRSGIPGEEA